MDFSLKEGLGILIAIVIAALCLVAFGNILTLNSQQAVENTVDDGSFFKSDVNTEISGRMPPKIEVQEIHLQLNSQFTMNDLIAYASATDAVDGDVSHSIKVYGVVDINTIGSYDVKFVAENTAGLKTSYIKRVLVD